MFVTSDASLYEKVLTLSNHGRGRGQTRQFWRDLIGFKYKMSNLQAAIGAGQMDRVDEPLARRREVFELYRKGLAGHATIFLNPEPAGTRNGFWMPSVVFARKTGVARERPQTAFIAENIDARVFFRPLSGLPPFAPAPGNINA